MRSPFCPGSGAGIPLGFLPGFLVVFQLDLDGPDHKSPLGAGQLEKFVGPLVELVKAVVGDVGFWVALPDQFFAWSTSCWKGMSKPQISWTLAR